MLPLYVSSSLTGSTKKMQFIIAYAKIIKLDDSISIII